MNSVCPLRVSPLLCHRQNTHYHTLRNTHTIAHSLQQTMEFRESAKIYRRQNTHNHTLRNTHTITLSSLHKQTMDDYDDEFMIKQSDVSLSLAKHVMISNEAKNENVVFSPLSIHVVLGLIALGSKGPTRDQILCYFESKSIEELTPLLSQMVALLFADGSPVGGPRLSTANSVWIDQSLTFKPSLKDVAENAYKAALNRVDFQNKAVEVTKEVNKWAKKQTNGLIKDILGSDSVDALTRLILANAVYFKGAWTQEFNASHTEDGNFFLLNGSSIQVPFMTNTKKQYVHAFDDFKVLRLPYKQGKDERQFSMYFFLPDAKDGLPSLLEKFGSESEFIERHIPHREIQVLGDFLVPKFKIKFCFEASEVLKRLGLVLPFSGDHDQAGLTEMVEYNGENMYVSSVTHKAFIEVNEKGSEAAAVSYAQVRCCCSPFMRKVDFVADHPFLFVIREDTTGAVLFVGQVLNPLAG